MKKNTLGIVFSNMHDETLGELTEHRTTGSIPFGGRYRLIDFTLSNMVNSGITDIGIITKSNYQSLMDHLGSGRDWDLARKRGGLCILPPFGHSATGMYRGRIEALAGAMSYIQHNNAQYVVMSDSDIVVNASFSDLLDQHIKTNADITAVYKRMNMTSDLQRNSIILDIDGDERVTGALVNSNAAGVQNIYTHVVVLRKDLLERLVNEGMARNNPDFVTFVLQGKVDYLKIMGYELKGYSTEIVNMKSYFKANMELLDADVRAQLFPKDKPVYTKVRDEVPVKYGLDSKVKNSLIADGCIIEGTVENSIIFRGVKIEKGAVVKNSIVMQGTTVSQNASLEYVVTDKDVYVNKDRRLSGSDTYPVFISKGSRA